MKKRIADFLEKFAVAALAVGIFQEKVLAVYPRDIFAGSVPFSPKGNKMSVWIISFALVIGLGILGAHCS